MYELVNVIKKVIICWFWFYIFQLIDISKICEAALKSIPILYCITFQYCPLNWSEVNTIVRKIECLYFYHKNLFIWSCSYLAITITFFVIVIFFFLCCLLFIIKLFNRLTKTIHMAC